MDDLLLSIFVAVEGAHAFSAFMPSAFTIRTFATDGAAVERLRAGYLPALGFLVILSLTVAGLKKSALPLVMGLLVGAFMVSVYESSISAAARESEA